MTSPWTWQAAAGLGSLHGLNPATGWLRAAAGGMRPRGRVPRYLLSLIDPLD